MLHKFETIVPERLLLYNPLFIIEYFEQHPITAAQLAVTCKQKWVDGQLFELIENMLKFSEEERFSAEKALQVIQAEQKRRNLI